MHTPPKSDRLCSNCHKMVNEEAIEQAISELESQRPPSFTATTTKKCNLDCITLMRRYKGKTISFSEAHSRTY